MYHLDRFLEAQADTYDQAIAELQPGKKEGHWMWWRGQSKMSKCYRQDGIHVLKHSCRSKVDRHSKFLVKLIP
ncbi:MAG: DUF1810 family protein [Pseudanabaenaceae cyanobacterium]